MKRLERELGLSLLERHPRGIAPTSAGRLLHTAVTEGLGRIDQAVHRIEELARAEGGSVRVTTGATTVRHFMAAAVVDFRRRFPRASLEFQTETSSRGCFDALAVGAVDLAWITLRPAGSAVEQRPVVHLPWSLAVAAGDRSPPSPSSSPLTCRMPGSSACPRTRPRVSSSAHGSPNRASGRLGYTLSHYR